MDNLNDKWLDDILKEHKDEKPLTPEEQAAVDMARTGELDLDKIVKETLAEDWSSESDKKAFDTEATMFFAPQASAHDEPEDDPFASLLTPEIDAEKALEEDAELDEEAFYQGIFDAVSLDSELLVGDGAINDTSIRGVPVLTDDGTVAEEPPVEPETSADDIIREILEEQPQESEADVAGAVVAGNTAQAAKTARPARPPRKKTTRSRNTDGEPKKGRPVRKDGYGLFGIPHIFSTAIWAALILFIGITLGKTVWMCAVDLLALGKTGQEVTITITEEDTLSDVAKKLETVGMIRYSSLFEAFASLTGKSESIRPGVVKFEASLIYDYNALISAMSYKDKPLDTIKITIPEGYTCKQIYALLEEKGVCPAKDLEEYAQKGELPEYWFLEGLPRNNKYCLEGYLFPDTYEFYLEAEPIQVFEKFLDTFEVRFSDRLKEKHEQLNKDLGLNLTMHEIVIMASMVQKEKASDPEGYKIAKVFYNRLVNSSSFPYLDCDSTILYAVEMFGLVTDAEINASPYHTYTHPGLPAGPICNPGLSSLDAALEPEDELKGYYYFVLDKQNNVHVFAKTLEEHERNKKKLGYYD